MPIVKSVGVFNGNLDFDKCSLYLNIDIKTYDNSKEYYYLKYVWSFKDNDVRNHILYDNKKFLESSNEGDIIAKNKLTDQLINFLIMKDDELEEVSGYTNSNDYKRSVIEAISLFWD